MAIENATELLPAGTAAPDFKLNVTPDQTLSLSELRGKPVILAFYPADWSPVCGDQMALYNEILPEFRKFGPNCWECPWMVPGVTRHSRRPVICISRCSPILSPKEPSPDNMAPTAPSMASASALYS